MVDVVDHLITSDSKSSTAKQQCIRARAHVQLEDDSRTLVPAGQKKQQIHWRKLPRACANPQSNGRGGKMPTYGHMREDMSKGSKWDDVRGGVSTSFYRRRGLHPRGWAPAPRGAPTSPSFMWWTLHSQKMNVHFLHLIPTQNPKSFSLKQPFK